MLSVLLAQAQDRVEQDLSPGEWNRILVESNLAAARDALAKYRDEDVLLVLELAAARTKRPLQAFMRDVGHAVASGLLGRFAAAMPPQVKGLDAVQVAARALSIKAAQGGARGGAVRFEVRREGPAELWLDFYAPRMLCPVAEGMVEGAGDVFGAPVAVRQTFCMYHGDPFCSMQIRGALAAAPDAASASRNA